MGDQKWGGNQGTIKAFETMRKQAPHMKLLLSVGGWSMSNSFSACTADAANRAKIVDSVKMFLQKYDFDGIDYDWEFPGIERTDGAGIPKFATKYTWDPEHDRDNFKALLKETRQMLTGLQAEKSRDAYLQTIAIGMGPDKIDYMAAMYQDEETMGTSLDFINLMTYDFHGGWDQTPFGHNAPLHPPKNNPKDNVGMSIQESVDRMVDLVGEKYTKKLVMGLPTYGRSINVPAGTEVEEALAEAKTLPLSASEKVMTWEKGTVSYWHQEYLAGQKGWEVKYDSEAHQTYLWNQDERVFMSYDTPADLKEKVKFLNSRKLGGAMFWEMDDDPMIYPKKMGDHAKDEKRQGEKLFDAVLEELESCQVPHRSGALGDIIV